MSDSKRHSKTSLTDSDSLEIEEIPKKPKIKVKKNFGILWLRDLLVITPFILGLRYWSQEEPEPLFYCSLLLLLATPIALATHRKCHILLYVYLISFFTFIYGRATVTTLFNYRTEDAKGINGVYSPDPHIVSVAFGNYHLFVGCVILAYIYTSRAISLPKKGYKPRHHLLRTGFLTSDTTQKTTKILFYLTLIPYSYYLIRVGTFVLTHGYYAYQQDRTQAAPDILRVSNDAVIVIFYIFLATKPTFRNLLTPSIVFIVARCCALVTMERNAAVLPILAFAIYFISRFRSDIFERFNRKHIAFLSIAMFAATFGALTAFARMNRSRGTGGAQIEWWQGPLEFFYGQGTTINIFVLYQRFGFEAPHNRFYALGPLIEFSQSNIARFFGDSTDYSYLRSHNEQHALEGHSFAHYFSYMHMGEDYLKGSSWGSSSVIELWVDFDVLGVALGAAFFGILLLLTQKSYSLSGIPVFIALMITRGLIFSPRSSFTEFLLPFSTRALVVIILTLALVVLVNLVTNHKKEGIQKVDTKQK